MTIARRSRDRFDDPVDDALRFCHVRLLLFPGQHFFHLLAADTRPPLRIVNVAESANAFVTTGQVHARFSTFQRATVLAAIAFVHIDAKAEHRGPFVARLQTLATDVDLIRHQAEEILILFPIQRAFSGL